MHIVTCGDSWSKGEWGGTDIVNHKGINQYLTNDGYRVKNLHQFSNKYAIQKLQDYLKNNSVDIVLFFLSDPLRNLSPQFSTHTFGDFYKSIKTLADLKNLFTKNLEENLLNLSKLDTKIYLLGGCQKYNKNNIKYPNVYPLVESIAELICPKYTMPEMWDSGWSAYLEFKKLPKEIFYYVEDIHKKQFSMELDEYAKWFRPDGYHPNRYGHKLLYEYCKENITELK